MCSRERSTTTSPNRSASRHWLAPRRREVAFGRQCDGAPWPGSQVKAIVPAAATGRPGLRSWPPLVSEPPRLLRAESSRGGERDRVAPSVGKEQCAGWLGDGCFAGRAEDRRAGRRGSPFRPDRERGWRRRRWPLAHASESQVRLQVVADQTGSKHTGDSRNRGKGGQPVSPITTPDRRGHGDAHLWREPGRAHIAGGHLLSRLCRCGCRLPAWVPAPGGRIPARRAR
jgi:hypothetical protein